MVLWISTTASTFAVAWEDDAEAAVEDTHTTLSKRLTVVDCRRIASHRH